MATLRCTESGGWDGIADALGRATPGDEVIIERGTYTGDASLKFSTKPRVHLRGEDGARLIYTGWLFAIKIFNSDDAKVSNLTIELSNVTPPLHAAPQGDPFAAAIAVFKSNDIAIERCVLNGNDFYGCGVLIETSLQTSIYMCSISNFGRAGIKLLSSQCVADRNKCIGNSCGISAKKYDKPDRGPSKLIATNNHCYNNKQSGIFLRDSIGTLTENFCFENKCNGINAQRVQYCAENPQYDLKLTATKNFCHDNNEDGIRLNNIRGELKDNRCWKNENGIYASKQFGHSELIATKNYCYNNNLAGIFLSSENGTLKGNECWNNVLGISAQANSDSRKISSELIATNNRCHDNRSGILLDSSLGTLKENECWNNVEGISASRSELSVINNRCYDNREANIEIPQCVGNLWDNNAIGIPPGMRAGVSNYPGKNNGQNFVHPGSWRNLRHKNGKTCINLLPPAAPEIEVEQAPPLDALSGLIRTGGCPHCFHRFWLGDEGEAFPEFPPLEPPAQPGDSSERVYTAKREIIHKPAKDANSHDVAYGTVELIRTPELNPSTAETVNNPLEQLVHRIKSVATPRIYSTAWVSADSADLDKIFPATIPNPSNLDRKLAVHQVDFASRPEKAESWLIEQWVTASWAERAKALLFAPAKEAMLWLLAFSLLAALSLLMKDWINPAVSELRERFGIWTQIIFASVVILICLELLTLFFNRHLPVPLRIPKPFFLKLVDLIGYEPIAKLMAPLEKCSNCTEANRRHWLKTRLLGYNKLFGLFGSKPDIVTFILREVSELSKKEQEELLELASLRHNNQRVLFITQMNGLGMLVNTWLEVLFPDGKAGLANDDEAYVIHNPKLLEIKFDPNQEKREIADIIREIIPILGYQYQPDEDGGAYIESLINDKWTFSDFLPALIIGSNHYSPMHLNVPYPEGFEEHVRQPLSDVLAHYASLFKLDGSKFPLSESLFQKNKIRADKAEALLTVLTPLTTPDDMQKVVYWRGRQAYRHALINILRDAFHQHYGNHERSKCHLSALMACGELFHLNEAIRYLGKWVTVALDTSERQRVALHCEAALLLMQERMPIDLSQTKYDPQVLYSAWDALTKAIHQPLKEIVRETECQPVDDALSKSAHQPLKSDDKESDFTVCASRISVVCLQAEAAINNQPPDLRSLLEQLINNPFTPYTNNRSIWSVFLFGVRDTLLRFSGMSSGNVQLLLEKRLRQDWARLTNDIKARLRTKLKEGDFDALIFKAMSETADENELIRICKSLVHRPAFLVANLLVLAIPGALAEKVAPAEIGATLQSIRNKVKSDPEMGASFIGIPCSVAAEVNRAAWHVLKTMQKDDWEWKSSQLPDMTNEIEGLALGTHGSVSRQLNKSEVVELEFKAG